MQLILRPTGNFQNVNGTECRRWEGRSDKGVPVTAWIAMVGVPSDLDNGEFQKELTEVKVEKHLVSFDYRMVAD